MRFPYQCHNPSLPGLPLYLMLKKAFADSSVGKKATALPTLRGRRSAWCGDPCRHASAARHETSLIWQMCPGMGVHAQVPVVRSPRREAAGGAFVIGQSGKVSAGPPGREARRDLPSSVLFGSRQNGRCRTGSPNVMGKTFWRSGRHLEGGAHQGSSDSLRCLQERRTCDELDQGFSEG